MLATWRHSLNLNSKFLTVSNTVKSDRVNALKKQYDAILEKDKERKERNDYILEKLDKMRYCTTVAQVGKRIGGNSDDSKSVYCKLSKHTIDSPLVPTATLRHVPPEDKAILLQEICKNYILIPKLRTRDYSQDMQTNPNIDENNDWKSKYDILQQIRKDEELPTINQNPYLCKAEKDTINETKTKKDQSFIEYKDDLQEFAPPAPDYNEHVPSEPYETINYNENSENLTETQENAIMKIEPAYGTANIPIESADAQFVHHPQFGDLEYVSTPQSTEYSQDFDANVKSDADAYIPRSNDNNTNQNNLDKTPDYNYEQNVNEYQTTTLNNSENYDQNYEDGISIPVIDTNDLVNEINKVVDNENSTEVAEQLEYPIETINTEDFTPPENIESQDGDYVKLESQVLLDNNNQIYSENPNIAVESTNEATENLFDPIIADNAESGGLETFNNEPYVEGNENYAYTQEGVAEHYNEEQSAPIDNYQQEEYAAYYGNVQAEDGSMSKAENEELQQPYDQNYEQQYGDGYDGQAYPQQYDQQYNQQEYDSPYTEQNTVQNYDDQAQEYTDLQENVYQDQQEQQQTIENQLDHEEGYAEQQNASIEATN